MSFFGEFNEKPQREVSGDSKARKKRDKKEKEKVNTIKSMLDIYALGNIF